jgi:hypothetical protein
MNTLVLNGIDGQHLWGFLTALGALSLLDEYARDRNLLLPRIAFREDGCAVLQSPISAEELTEALSAQLLTLQHLVEHDFSQINKPSDFTRSSYQAIVNTNDARLLHDFIAGLACVVDNEADESTLCAANGASHQNLLQSMRDILRLVEAEHLRLALFTTWQRSYQVPAETRKRLQLGTRKPTLRFDPSDERLYALRLTNPTTENDFATELGAQALSIAVFRLLPVVPSKTPVTVASRRARTRVTFEWPLWNVPATLPTLRSLIWSGVRFPNQCRERGVFSAYGADRVSGAKGKLSFSPSEGIW